MTFQTDEGQIIPAVTADQMREVDRVAVEVFGLGILQMMENAGRGLAQQAIEMLGGASGQVVVLAGAGGNGGGGLCCARHLSNRGWPVTVLLDRQPEALQGPAAAQLQILRTAGLHPTASSEAEAVLHQADLVVDALVGYGQQDAPRGETARLITLCNQSAPPVLANDLPSGMDATTGAAPGTMIQAQRTLTLAAPKTGLARLTGALYLADLGIPPAIFERIGIPFAWRFGSRDTVRLIIA